MVGFFWEIFISNFHFVIFFNIYGLRWGNCAKSSYRNSGRPGTVLPTCTVFTAAHVNLFSNMVYLHFQNFPCGTTISYHWKYLLAAIEFMKYYKHKINILPNRTYRDVITVHKKDSRFDGALLFTFQNSVCGTTNFHHCTKSCRNYHQSLINLRNLVTDILKKLPLSLLNLNGVLKVDKRTTRIHLNLVNLVPLFAKIHMQRYHILSLY